MGKSGRSTKSSHSTLPAKFEIYVLRKCATVRRGYLCFALAHLHIIQYAPTRLLYAGIGEIGTDP